MATAARSARAGQPAAQGRAAARRPERPGRALSGSFYERPVLEVARDLIGCVVEHGATSGVIVETEAYHESEPACHAFVGVTARTRTIFGPPGRAYVYLSYGIHALLNAVCDREGVGAAVLIRALEPLTGVELMRARRNMPASLAREQELCSGPGKLTQALSIGLECNDDDLRTGALLIRARPARWRQPAITHGLRVGITKAAELPWRFCAAGNSYVSRPRPRAL